MQNIAAAAAEAAATRPRAFDVFGARKIKAEGDLRDSSLQRCFYEVGKIFFLAIPIEKIESARPFSYRGDDAAVNRSALWRRQRHRTCAQRLLPTNAATLRVNPLPPFVSGDARLVVDLVPLLNVRPVDTTHDAAAHTENESQLYKTAGAAFIRSLL